MDRTAKYGVVAAEDPEGAIIISWSDGTSSTLVPKRPRCQHETQGGVCDAVLDEHGNCWRASEHLS